MTKVIKPLTDRTKLYDRIIEYILSLHDDEYVLDVLKELDRYCKDEICQDINYYDHRLRTIFLMVINYSVEFYINTHIYTEAHRMAIIDFTDTYDTIITDTIDHLLKEYRFELETGKRFIIS
jgi:hypothetical protein